MRRGGPLAVLAAAVAMGGLVMWASRGRYPKVKLPGPCEIQQRVRHPDMGSDDFPAERQVFRYDAEGRKVREERIIDTQAMETLRWEYDADGHMVLEERTSHGPIHHTDADGTQRVFDHRTDTVRWTYDEHGRMLTREFERADDDLIPHVTRYEYDADGRKTAAHATWEGKYSSDTEFEYDARGRLVVERGNGGATRIIRYEHDEAGHVVKQTEDYLSDGDVDITYQREYDVHGRLVREARQERGIGTIVTTWTYDDVGNPLTRNERMDDVKPGNGVTDTYDYSCWTLDGDIPVDRRPG